MKWEEKKELAEFHYEQVNSIMDEIFCFDDDWKFITEHYMRKLNAMDIARLKNKNINFEEYLKRIHEKS